jgi:hypothetical protein
MRRRSVRLYRVLWALVLLSFAVTALASAQDGSDGAGVRLFLERGVAEYAAGRWAEARALFEQAHEREPTARTARGIGMAAFNQRDYVGAVRFLALALESTAQALTEQQRAQVQDLHTQALSFVGRFRFDATRPEAKIWVRGMPVEQGAECLLPIGSHMVRAHAPGFLPTERAVEVHGGEQTRLTLTLVLEPKPSAPPPPPPPPLPRDRMELWGWSLLGGAGAMAGAGLAVKLRANARFDDLERRCEKQRCFPETTDTRKVVRLDNGAAALFIGSASVAATAGALLTTAWLRSHRRNGDRLQVGWSGQHVQIRVRY